MRKIHILKVGSTLPTIKSQKGDFEDWILSGMGLSRQDCCVMDVRRTKALPAFDSIAAIVITGSHSMLTEHRLWSERVARWLPAVIARDIPLLGICYGHQLLAYAMGGKVGDNPKGSEYGVAAVHLDPSARLDPLLGGFISPVKVYVSHNQSVLQLPAEARCLAWSDGDDHQAFMIGKCAWGVQFHPEFDVQIVQSYIRHARKKLLAEGQHVDKLLAESQESPSGAALLSQFAKMARANLSVI